MTAGAFPHIYIGERGALESARSGRGHTMALLSARGLRYALNTCQAREEIHLCLPGLTLDVQVRRDRD
jgi:hypothetical protein